MKLNNITTAALALAIAFTLTACDEKAAAKFSIYGVWRYVGSADVEHGETWHDESTDLITIYDADGMCVIAIGNSVYNGVMHKRDGYSHQFNAHTRFDLESWKIANIEGQGPYTFAFNYDPVKRRLIDSDGTVERYFEWVQEATGIPTTPQTRKSNK
jgi:hypothetical protein